MKQSFFRKAKGLIMLSILAMTAQTAWADNLTSANLLIDSEIPEGTAGHYYYTMPRECNHTLTITEQDISDGKGTFNVYDCGGKNHDQDGYNLYEELVITAPLGYIVKITGTAKTDDKLYSGSENLNVYDGTSTSGTYLATFGTTSYPDRYNVNVQSSSNSIMLKFRSYIYSIKGRGLNLTVSLVEVPYYISYATINIEKYHRYTGSAVELGYTVDDSKGNRLTQGTHYNAIIKDNNGSVVESAISEGHYTLTIEGISPYSGSKTVDFWVNENPGVLIDSDIPEGTLGHFFSLMPKSGSATVDLTQSDVATLMIYDDGGKGGGYDGYTSGNFTPKANGYLLLHAPAGFQIHLTGHVRTRSANAYLTVHDGNTESALTLCANVHGENSSAGSPSYKDVTVDVISTGEYMLLHFDAGALAWGWDSEGLILTASIGHSITVADGITHGSVSCNNFWIKGSSTNIPLTVTPTTGYRTNTVSYNDGSDHTLTADVNGDYSFTMPSKKVTVNATFAPITYTVSFNANGGTGDAMAAQNFTYDAAQNLTANTYTRTGYTFAGWATTADGDVAYADGAEVSNLAMTQGANVELYAKWTANTYYVHFNANDGTGTMDNEEFTYDAVAKALTANTFTRTGYTFAGWATAADGAVAYVDQAEVSNLTATANGIFDLYAKWKKLLTNTDITISIPSQEWTDGPLSPVITVKDGETTLTETTDYTVTAPSGMIQDAGDYTYTITGAGNYSGETTATFTITPKTVTNSNITNTSSEATIMLTQDQNGTTATLDGASEGSVTITADVTVGDVKLGRTFNNGQKTAICWPFEVTASEATGLGTFYEFKGINGEGKIEMQVVSTGLAANTPYIFEPKADITDAIDFGAKTLKAGGPVSVGNGFTYKGIYSRVRWTTNASDPLYNAELANELGRAYGFALETKTDLNGKKTYSPGQFVMLGEGAHSRAFRAYMLYDGAWDGNAPSAAARRATRGMSLPNTIDIVWLTASGQTTGISTISPFSDSDTWYSLDGRRLSGKPTKKGLYIHNGKKVTIK